MKPTVGRIVHYKSLGSTGGEFLPECRAAIVAGIPKRTRAATSKGEDLAVLNPSGLFFDRVLQDEETKAGGTWHWPCEIVAPAPAAVASKDA